MNSIIKQSKTMKGRDNQEGGAKQVSNDETKTI